MTAFVPNMHGVIDRRMLVNFRAHPGIVAKILPSPFRPKLAHGWAMVGICLLRLKDIRPHGFPAWLGVNSENAAHRIAVEWDENGSPHEGVYIPRRDTNSLLNRLAGGRLFPGLHHHARFDVNETPDEFQLLMHAHDGGASVELKAHLASRLTPTSIFISLAEASEFFARGSVGY